MARLTLIQLLALAGYATTASADAARVTTSSGILQGQIASNTDGVSEYLGIPYAQPPVGSLRWAPPVAYNGTDVIDATAFGNTCPATTGITSASQLQSNDEVTVTPQGVDIIMAMLAQADVMYSEDCLTLNVWTKPQTGEASKAVLVWIYGGGYTSGTTNTTAYNGKYLADTEDVIIVTVNYRVGFLGFPGNPDSRTNLGLLDQRLAVEWVRDNIAAFGGDPDRITLFGQSAGGSSVDYYAYAWTEDPIVAGFICESGTVFTPGTPVSAADASAKWTAIATALGCTSSDSTEVTECMRAIDWQTVQDTSLAVAAASSSSGIAGISSGFGPSVDNIVVFADYAAQSASGSLIKRPLLIGENNDEAGLFKVIFGLTGQTQLSDAEWSFLETSLFTCALSERALASLCNSVPTWRYRYFGNFPDLQLSTVPDSGAWHGIEIPTIFGTDLDIQNAVQRTPAQEQVAAYVRGMWVAFAKDPVNGLTNYGLPKYNPLAATLLQLAYYNQTGPNTVNPAVYDIGCVIDEPLLGILEALGLI
ncbi:hypothetical protein SBRCBS47491_003757 [Sporothrix bragantina]|uniref:Carboxylic ester hydrolase n=1 Tax=Sporothrix bragantina TaxID=671064 RepID=A0ABP0BI56_9PEZI